jgi:uncharacterized protein (DUF983 family)
MPAESHSPDAGPTRPERLAHVSASKAMLRGFRCRCPNCGDGRVFRAFLKVTDRCPACGEELHHHQADDFPAYIVIVLVGHIVVPLLLSVELAFAPPYWVHMALWPAMVLGLGLGLLQPVKGAVVGMQWALGMHGFEAAKLARDGLAGAMPTADFADGR